MEVRPTTDRRRAARSERDANGHNRIQHVRHRNFLHPRRGGATSCDSPLVVAFLLGLFYLVAVAGSSTSTLSDAPSRPRVLLRRWHTSWCPRRSAQCSCRGRSWRRAVACCSGPSSDCSSLSARPSERRSSPASSAVAQAEQRTRTARNGAGRSARPIHRTTGPVGGRRAEVHPRRLGRARLLRIRRVWGSVVADSRWGIHRVGAARIRLHGAGRVDREPVVTAGVRGGRDLVCHRRRRRVRHTPRLPQMASWPLRAHGAVRPLTVTAVTLQSNHESDTF